MTAEQNPAPGMAEAPAPEASPEVLPVYSPERIFSRSEIGD